MSEAVAEAFVETVLRPILDELHRESDQQLNLAVVILGATKPSLRQVVESSPSQRGHPAAEGEVRVVVRPTADVAVVRFEAESIVDGLSPESGYSGFSLRGKLDMSAQPAKVHVAGKTNRYNVRSWGKKFRLPGE